MDEAMVDDMVKEIDPENKGLVDILEFAKICFNIKEKEKWFIIEIFQTLQ